MEATLEQRQKLKEFADKSQLNKDILLLVLQGVPVPAIAQNLGVGTGSVFARIKAANEIFGNNGGPSCTALKESLRAMQLDQRERLKMVAVSEAADAAVERQAIINNSGDTIDVTRWDYS